MSVVQGTAHLQDPAGVKSGVVLPAELPEGAEHSLSGAMLKELYVRERRELRSRLHCLAHSVAEKEAPELHTSLLEVGNWLGPRFRYEEEDLYPQLAPALSHHYIETLLEDHDSVIEVIGLLLELTSLDSLGAQDRIEGVGLILSLLDHTYRSCGLSLVIEELPDETAREILAARAEALRSGVGLLEWSRGIRRRAPRLTREAYLGGKWPAERITPLS